jgi:hypothetical protein
MNGREVPFDQLLPAEKLRTTIQNELQAAAKR